jgi:regulator of replication initiation timing
MREQPTELTLQAQLEDLKEELEKMSAENAKLRAKSHEASRIQQYLYNHLI